MRERGYYEATVEHEEMPDPVDATGTRRIVVYTITPGEQAHVGQFIIKIDGFDQSAVQSSLKLQSGIPFTRDVLGDALNRVKQALISKGSMATQLDAPDVQYDP